MFWLGLAVSMVAFVAAGWALFRSREAIREASRPSHQVAVQKLLAEYSALIQEAYEKQAVQHARSMKRLKLMERQFGSVVENGADVPQGGPELLSDEPQPGSPEYKAWLRRKAQGR